MPNQSLINTKLTSRERLFFILSITAGIFLRFYDINLRPLHHDEALYGSYSFYFFQDPIEKFYRYNPLLHGPFLFNIFPWFFEMLGTSDASLRIPMAINGSLLLLVPYIFRSYIGKATLLFSTLAIALSPTLIYWSRFLAIDTYVLLSLVGIMVGVFLINSRYKLTVTLGFISLLFCIKENSFVYVAMAIGFILYESLLERCPSSSLMKVIGHIKTYKLPFFIGVLTAILIYFYLYTSGFKYSEGILDGLYRKSLSYWFDQHKVERLQGPFAFNFFFLSWYEHLIIALSLVHFFYSFIKFNRKFKIITCSSIIFTSILYLGFKFSSSIQIWKLWSFFKIKYPIDVFVCFHLIFQSLIHSFWHFTQKQKALFFWSYFYFANFFTYSFLGEKVPWLSIYIVFTGFIFFSLYFKDLIEKIYLRIQKNKVVLGTIIFFIILQLRFTLMINWGRVNSDDELIRQVHTTQNIESLAHTIKKQLDLSSNLAVLTLNAPTWPLAWHFKDIPNYRFFESTLYPPRTYDHIFDEETHIGKYDLLKESHTIYTIPFRSWWVPDYNNMKISDFLKYAFFHVPWNEPGTMNIIYIKKKEGL